MNFTLNEPRSKMTHQKKKKQKTKPTKSEMKSESNCRKVLPNPHRKRNKIISSSIKQNTAYARRQQ